MGKEIFELTPITNFSITDNESAITITFQLPSLKSFTQSAMPHSCHVVAFLSQDLIYIYPNLANSCRGKEVDLSAPEGYIWILVLLSGNLMIARGCSKSKGYTLVSRT